VLFGLCLYSGLVLYVVSQLNQLDPTFLFEMFVAQLTDVGASLPSFEVFGLSRGNKIKFCLLGKINTYRSLISSSEIISCSRYGEYASLI
jgi:hypothetical protein